MTETNSRHKIIIDMPDNGYIPYPLEILDISTFQVFHPEKRKGDEAEISFRLTKDGYMRIRVVKNNNKKIILHTLLTWTKKGVGRYSLKWDIRDSIGTLLNPETFHLVFQTKDEDDLLIHREHDENSCKDPLIRLELQHSDKTNGNVRIMAALKNEPFRRFVKKGYKASLFIGSKLIEEEMYMERPDLFEFTLPQLLLTAGDMITVNINDNYDHIGAGSIYWQGKIKPTFY